MSRYRLTKVEFKCSGCESYTMNCPGHVMECQVDCSSDSYEFFMDGKSLFACDENVFHAMMKTMK